MAAAEPFAGGSIGARTAGSPGLRADRDTLSGLLPTPGKFTELAGPMLDAGSRFIGYLGVGVDVTERMRRDRELLHRHGARDPNGNEA